MSPISLLLCFITWSHVTATNITINVGSTTGNPNVFDPADVIINIGDTITWVWINSGIPHTVTSGTVDSSTTYPDGTFCTLSSGGIPNITTCQHSEIINTLPYSYTYTFITIGYYPYYCAIHYSNGMIGSVMVVDNMTINPSTTPSPTDGPTNATNTTTIPPTNTPTNATTTEIPTTVKSLTSHMYTPTPFNDTTSTSEPTNSTTTTPTPTDTPTPTSTSSPTNETTTSPPTNATTLTPTTSAPTNNTEPTTTPTPTSTPTNTTTSPPTSTPTNATTTTSPPTHTTTTTSPPTNSTLTTTNSSTTSSPTTLAPTTQAPTTQAPTTQAPTTQVPTTRAPTTSSPTTRSPTPQSPSSTGGHNSSSTGGSLNNGAAGGTTGDILTTTSSSSSVSKGALIGIIVGCICGGLLLLILFGLCYRTHMAHQREQDARDATLTKSHLATHNPHLAVYDAALNAVTNAGLDGPVVKMYRDFGDSSQPTPTPVVAAAIPAEPTGTTPTQSVTSPPTTSREHAQDPILDRVLDKDANIHLGDVHLKEHRIVIHP